MYLILPDEDEVIFAEKKRRISEVVRGFGVGPSRLIYSEAEAKLIGSAAPRVPFGLDLLLREVTISDLDGLNKRVFDPGLIGKLPLSFDGVRFFRTMD